MLWIDPQLSHNEDLQQVLIAWEEAWVTWIAASRRSREALKLSSCLLRRRLSPGQGKKMTDQAAGMVLGTWRTTGVGPPVESAQ